MTKQSYFKLVILAILPILSVVHAQDYDVPSQPNLDAISFIMIDFDTGKVLAEKNPDQRLQVASLNKLMTAYVVMDEAQRDQLDLNAEVIISQNAGDTGGSTMFLSPRTRVPAPEILKGLVVHSGNDAAVALAEWVGGTEDGFVDLMNKNANILGLKNTLYRNSSGLPTEREQYSTARDLAILTKNLIYQFPDHYDLYKIKHWKYAGITQPNRNGLLRLDSSVDGVKTGHTDEAGFCLVSSAQRKGMRLIVVLLGADSESQRIQFSRQLLEYGFRNFYTQEIIDSTEEVGKVPVYGGISSEVSVGVRKSVKITLPLHWFHQYEIKRQVVASKLLAPIREGDNLGTVTLYIEKEDANFTAGKRLIKTVLHKEDLVAKQHIFSSGYINQTIARVRLMILNLFSTEDEE